MDIETIKERLEKLDSSKLIDIVKNYRQYGYTDDVRAYAMDLLQESGISIEDLRLTGNLENTTYNYANSVFSNYKRDSMTAFLAYCFVLFIKALSIFHLITPGNFTVVVFMILIITYLIFLVRSFLDQNDFYKITGEDFGSGGILVYLLLGMPFYIIMYFVFQKQMKEKMVLIK